LAGLPPKLQDRARSIADQLDSNPALGKKLVGGLRGIRSARLGRSHRILYRLVDGRPTVLTIGQRKDVYG
jgi:hypothetical protein